MFARLREGTALCRPPMLGMRRGHAFFVRASLFLAFAMLAPASAHAYPWMIRHHYTNCGLCHVDPSGSGPLTEYGRALGDVVLRTRTDDDGAVKPSAGFLFGAVKPPEWLDLGGDLRLMLLRSKAEKSQLIDRTIWMQLDAEATIDVGHFIASGSLGYAPEGALGAALTRAPEKNLISRQHWLGYQDKSIDLLVRLGRMNLPFGIRTVEHTLGVRQLTLTNINDQQQYGAAVAISSEKLRGELMGIAGNLQLRPDDYRERGYSAYLEWAPVERLAFGASSLLTHRSRDTIKLKETWRHAHGLFARWVPGWEPLVLQTEWDWVLSSSKDEFHRSGLVSFLQADIEFVQGMHFMATGEANNVGTRERFWTLGGWASYAWFFAPHADLRLDVIRQSIGSSLGSVGVTTLLLQGHMFL